jgi:hypothetical protein
MLRALFLRELRRSWLTHAGLFAAVIGTITFLERALLRGGPPSPEDEDFINRFLLAGLVLSGLISGERCFSKSFKEDRYPFLLTLPRSRSRIWLSYLGGRLLGALAALPILLLRWLVSSPPQSGEMSWPLLISAAAVYLVYFLGGSVLALALPKEVLVYLVGFPLLTAPLLLLAYSASYGFAPYDQADLQTTPRYLFYISGGSLLLALMWTTVAQRAFCRGELHLGRRTAQILAEAGLATASFAFLAVVAFSSTNLAVFRDEWQLLSFNTTNPATGERQPARPDVEPDFPYSADTRPVSSDGRFLFIYQQLRERPFFSRLAIVDLKNGRSSGWLERPGIHQISWSSSGIVLNVLATDNDPYHCFGFPCEGSTSWYRLSSDLHVMSVRKFAGIAFFRQFDGTLLLVTRQGNVGRIFRLSDADASLRQILTSELEDDPQAWSLDRGAVVVFPRAASLQAWWLDQEGQLRHEASMKRAYEGHYYLVGLRILYSQEVKAEILRRALPLTSTNLDIGVPLLPEANGPLELADSQFFLRQGKVNIWKHDSRRGGWTRIVSGYRRIEGTWTRKGWGSVRLGNSDVDYRTWTWVSVVASGARKGLFLYDDKLGRSVPNMVSCNEYEVGIVELERVQGVHGLLVRYTCSGQAGRQRHWFLNFVPGSGRVQYLPAQSAAVPPDLFKRWIYLGSDGVSIWVSTTGEVWQVEPGQRSRRVNPPER